jgi:hypothetical protein
MSAGKFQAFSRKWSPFANQWLCVLWLCRCSCFAEADGTRLVPFALGTVNMTVAKCAGLAKAAQYTVFALQYGQE